MRYKLYKYLCAAEEYSRNIIFEELEITEKLEETKIKNI